MAIRLEYRIVDVFSGTPLAGNALCVVVDPCPEDLQPAIAREVNLSETTFPVVIGDGAYEVRIRTPETELPFAGHPTLGTAWVLGPGRWAQTSEGGTVQVEADAGGAVMEVPDPSFVEVDGAAPSAALGLPAHEEAVLADCVGMRHVVVLTDAPIGALRPDLAAVAAAARRAGGQSICVARRIDDRTLQARVFLPGAGIPEDPGTGSAAAPIAELARRRWGTEVDVAILQGAEVGRPGRMEVHAEKGSFRVGGRVVQCATGHFTL
ncbi:MAG: PhzF family phenazine biosynthesis protein [Acidimicrobiales bacterium]